MFKTNGYIVYLPLYLMHNISHLPYHAEILAFVAFGHFFWAAHDYVGKGIYQRRLADETGVFEPLCYDGYSCDARGEIVLLKNLVNLIQM